MKINKDKIEVIIRNRRERKKLSKRIGNEEVQKVKEFHYLENKITKDGWSGKNITSRTA